ncbi:hypothetical protein [Nonomuraea sp. LPB2021202275-12-8]|uniref:hypothetical protein n=1 Tax=Nonomuraea sp. LPB2021202275-12-8 TaxID=3120159 RepID=UPI00300CCA65
MELRRFRVLAAMAAPLWVVALTAPAAARAVPDTSKVAVARAGVSASDTQPGIIEEGAYPDAERILAERGITLISGNGLITLADCGAPGTIQLYSAEKGYICFQVRIWPAFALDSATLEPALNSFVVLRIPDVYVIKGTATATQQATLTVDDQTKTYDIRPGEWTPVGEGVDPENPPETLVELRAGQEKWW